MTLLASEIPRPLACALHREPNRRPRIPSPLLLTCPRSGALCWASPAPEPHPPVAPTPSREGPPGQKRRCNPSDFPVQSDFHLPPCPTRRFAFAHRRVVVGEAVYRGGAGACQTLCDENFSNSVCSSRGAFPRKAERLQTPSERALPSDPTAPRWRFPYTRARGSGCDFEGPSRLT